MNNLKWRCSTLTLITSICLSVGAQAVTDVQSDDDRLLEKRILTEFSSVQPKAEAEKFSFRKAMNDIKNFRRSAAGTPKCADKDKKVFANKYVLSTDESGKPCRIYDLSFPTLRTLFSAKNTMQVPVQKLTSRDYLNWVDGNEDAVERNREEYKRNFNPLDAARNSWVAKLKFKFRPSAVEGSRTNNNEIGLPRTFKVTDLDIGSDYGFDGQTQVEINEFITELRMQEAFLSPDSEYMLSVLKRPEAMLDGVRFNWNDLEKVYDVVIDGDFLPFSGPVTLVDYQVQYRYAVQKIFRSILSSGLQSLAQRIPHPLMSSVVEVLIHDAFEQMEMAYSYQMALLEDTLRSSAVGRSDIGIDVATSTRALNILHGQRSDLITTYILAVAQGKPFDWTAFEAMGKTARYNVEKQRDVMMNKMNSALVLQKKCQNDFMMDYFAVCSQAGSKNAIYSLISDQVVVNKSFGAPLLYRFQRPYEATLRRGTAWVLSLALRVFGLPISRQAVTQLDPIIKSFVSAGVLDEALMRNALYQQSKSGVRLDNDSSTMLKWLYIQNLNPFLPKSLESEERVIALNKKFMGLN